jgi:hypothetical protein
MAISFAAKMCIYFISSIGVGIIGAGLCVCGCSLGGISIAAIAVGVALGVREARRG